MKRSEILDIIQDALLDYADKVVDDGSFMFSDSYKSANKLLDKLEVKGLLPPDNNCGREHNWDEE